MSDRPLSTDGQRAEGSGGAAPRAERSDQAQLAPEWAELAAAGGVREWVEAELRRRGLIEEVDTSRLTDAERKLFKARREEERRVRRLLRKAAWASYKRGNLVHLGAGVFYHDTADADRFDLDDPGARRQENELPELKDVQALAQALELPLPRLRWLTFHREVDTGTHYHRWTVPKRDGGERLISAPKPELKRAQRWIAQRITEHLPAHGASHGFLAGRSTASNAAPHAAAQLVVKLDLRDFYPTVTFPRVKGVFRRAGYGEQVATVLALLCTEAPREELEARGQRVHVAVGPRALPQGAPTSPSLTNALCRRLDARLDGLARYLGLRYTRWPRASSSSRGQRVHVAVGPRALPQGAPTSPSLTNALCRRLDARLDGLARYLGLRYTRYADDLTFSWHQDGRAQVGKLLGGVRRVVREEGFSLHRDKTRIMREGGRQKVTGLVVNAAAGRPPARVPRDVARRLRAAIRNRELGRPGRGESLEQLRGLAAYVHMTDPERGRAFLARLDLLAGKNGEVTP